MRSTWVSAGSSDPRPSRARRGAAIHRAAAGLAAVCLLASAGLARSRPQEEAMRAAFPGADRVEAVDVFLTEEQLAAASRGARARIESPLVTFYEARRGNEVLGRGLLDTRRVRTATATVLVALEPSGRLREIRILAFHEPRDYLPTPGWLRLFRGKGPAHRLQPGRDLAAVSGATLTTRSIAVSARAALSLHAQAFPTGT